MVVSRTNYTQNQASPDKPNSEANTKSLSPVDLRVEQFFHGCRGEGGEKDRSCINSIN